MERFRKNVLKALKIISEIANDNIGLYAAQASFFLIISLIPFVMLLLTLVKFVIPVNEADILSALSPYIPSQISPWVDTITDEIFDQSANISLISATAITTLWLSSRGFMALYSGLNNVFDIDDIPNYFFCRILSVFYTVCFLTALFLAIILFGFGNKIQEFISGKFSVFSNVISFILSMRILIFLTLMTLCFAAFYSFLTHRKKKFKKQLPGAALAATGWMIFSYAYSIYIENYSNYSYVYGSLTAIVFLMLWLYFCIDIFMYGAEFNKLLENGEFKKN